MAKVRIVWNNEVGELDSVTVKDDGEQSISQALIDLVDGHIVSAGDTFVIETVSS